MRVALFGNIANNAYQIALALRRYTDWDVRLLLDEREPKINRPENDSPELQGGYPDWIERQRFLTARSMAWPPGSPIVAGLRAADLAIVSGHGPVFAQFTGKPYCFFVTGGDLTMSPFPLRFHFTYPTLRAKLVMGLLALWQRRGVRRSMEIWTQPFAPFVDAERRLRIDPRRISRNYYPLIIDTEKLRLDKRARASDDPNIRQIVDQHDFVVFHPSRLMIKDHPHLRATGQWKRNEALFEGFARFLAAHPGARAVLVMPDRTYSPDLALGKEIVRGLGIEPHVFWARPPRPEGFTRDELIAYYSVSDVVADDFGMGWFGAVVLEALAIGKPVVSYVDETVMQELYPWHPIVSVQTPETIGDALGRLYADPAERRARGARGREWMETFHSPAQAGARYVRQITALLHGR